MKDKKNETITLEEFIEIVESMKKHYGSRITYIRMTEEFYNYLMSQRKYIFIENRFEVNNILGITVIKVPNGKLESFYNCKKIDWEIIPSGTKC